MTRSEIKLLVFLVLTILTGWLAKRHHDAHPIPASTAPVPAPPAWSKPPYVYKKGRDPDKAGSEIASGEAPR